MTRHILEERFLHPAIRQTVAERFRDTVEEVQSAIAGHRIVVVGMAGNPSVRRARQLLHARQLDFRYLEYGSYFNQWRRRNSLKMWTGWPTFPMVFIDGILIGGYQDLKALAGSDDLGRMLATPRA